MDKKLFRSRSDRMISGVCGGLAEYLALDPTLVRVGVVLLAVVTQGGIVIAYLVMSIVVPEEPLPASAGVAEAAPSMAVSIDQGGTTMGESDGQTTPSSMPETPTPPVVPTVPAAAWTSAPAAVPEKRRGGRGGVGFGVLLVLIGALLLVNEFVPGIDVWRFWPLIIIAMGLSAVLRGVRR